MARKTDTVVILDQVSGYAQIDIIEALKSEYSQCVLIAGEIKERNKPFPESAIWERIKPYNRNTSYKRISSWLIGSIQIFFKVLFKYRKARIIAISNPPFAVFIPWLLKCNYDIVIYDIYPDALVHMGYLKESSFLVKYWSKLNRLVFEQSKRIITLSEGMKEVLGEYADLDKVEVIPNWSFNSDLHVFPKDENVILQKLGITNKFIISYSGNFGVTHPLEVLVELAAALDPNVFHIVMAGDGARKPIIQKAIDRLQPTNFSLLPWQPAEDLEHVLSMGDFGVVVLDDTAANISIPSKTYDLLSAGTPILGICSKTSSLSELLEKNVCGITVKRDSVAEIVNLLKEMSNNPTELKELSNNALKTSKMFTTENAKLYV